MRVVFVVLCIVVAVASQTKNQNGNPTGEIGSPAFDEIVVHSVLNVRGKTPNRGAKTLTNDPVVRKVKYFDPSSTTSSTTTSTSTSTTEAPALTRSKREPRRNYGAQYGGLGGFGAGSSSSQASSNAFNQNTPFGSFGGSASQTSSQSQNFGPYGGQASASQSASQTYRLPNGNQIAVSFSGGYTSGKGGPPSFSNSHSVTLTRPNGQTHQLAGRGRR